MVFTLLLWIYTCWISSSLGLLFYRWLTGRFIQLDSSNLPSLPLLSFLGLVLLMAFLAIVSHFIRIGVEVRFFILGVVIFSHFIYFSDYYILFSRIKQVSRWEVLFSLFFGLYLLYIAPYR
ncbi:MAG: hypothetical protein AAFU64_18735, partial [Bacteroidota bacterium]